MIAGTDGPARLHQVARKDSQHPLWLRVPSSDAATYKQVFIDKEYDFGTDRQPQVIIDAGANIGLASVYFADKYPQAKILAIEPEASNFDVLKKNTAPYPNIIPIQAALWDRNEEIDLIDPGRDKWGFITEAKDTATDTNSTRCHTIKGMTVDAIIRDYGLDRIDILKVDIEGAEKEVFRDTSAWIDKVDAVIVELHERFKPGCNRSVYCGTNGFDHEWMQGENVYLSRGNRLIQRTA